MSIGLSFLFSQLLFIFTTSICHFYPYSILFYFSLFFYDFFNIPSFAVYPVYSRGSIASHSLLNSPFLSILSSIFTSSINIPSFAVYSVYSWVLFHPFYLHYLFSCLFLGSISSFHFPFNPFPVYFLVLFHHFYYCDSCLSLSAVNFNLSPSQFFFYPFYQCGSCVLVYCYPLFNCLSWLVLKIRLSLCLLCACLLLSRINLSILKSIFLFLQSLWLLCACLLLSSVYLSITGSF